jgi:hypothetical protein
MSYSDLTIDSAARILDLQISDRLFVPDVQPIPCDPVLLTYIQRGRVRTDRSLVRNLMLDGASD